MESEKFLFWGDFGGIMSYDQLHTVYKRAQPGKSLYKGKGIYRLCSRQSTMCAEKIICFIFKRASKPKVG
jgi:hypothetical protein